MRGRGWRHLLPAVVQRRLARGAVLSLWPAWVLGAPGGMRCCSSSTSARYVEARSRLPSLARTGQTRKKFGRRSSMRSLYDTSSYALRGCCRSCTVARTMTSLQRTSDVPWQGLLRLKALPRIGPRGVALSEIGACQKHTGGSL